MEAREQRAHQALAQEQRRRYEDAMADGHSHLGQTDSRIYGFFENDINAGANNNRQYSHHSAYWENKVNE
jgi:hypothetical protein